MQIPVNKDLDSYKDDFFKGLTLKQTAISIVCVAAGTLSFLVGSLVFHLSEAVSFYLALPVVLPIAASAFLRIHGMSPPLFLRRRRNVLRCLSYHFVPDVLLDGEKETSSLKENARPEDRLETKEVKMLG